LSLPPLAFLADVYRQVPLLVIHVTTDGVVLHCNPETCRVTGYEEGELAGKNLWATLFPGKLFAQVPRFISLMSPSPLLKDVPMTIRTKSGVERVIGFSRHMYADVNQAQPANSASRSFICIGVDLTDRLLDAERAQLPQASDEPESGTGMKAFGPHIGNAGAIDGEIVTPIAISPRPPGTTGPCPIEQVREGLARVETHIHCVRGAFDEGEMQTLASFAGVLHGGATRENRMGYEMVALGHDLHLRACAHTLGTIRARVDELLALHRPELP
jgi:PAS domain S-box-containing protein